MSRASKKIKDAIANDDTGLLAAFIGLVRDFMVHQLMGGHAPEDRHALIARADALHEQAKAAPVAPPAAE